MRRRRRGVLLLMLIPVVLAGGLYVLTYRQVRQIELNQALIAAIRGNRTAEALSLLDRGADPNARAPERDPQPLWRFVLDRLRGRELHNRADTALFLSVIKPDRIKLVGALLKHGADPNAKMDSGFNPLVMAVLIDDPQGTMVRQLLEHGAKVNVVSDGRTPLSAAILPGNLAVMKLLLDHGADGEMWDGFGRPPLHHAAYGAHPLQKVQLLLDHHANVNSRDRRGHTMLYNLYHDPINDQRLFTEVIRRIKRAGATQ